MSLELTAALSTVALFFGMLVLSEAGRRIGIARHATDSEGFTKGASAAEAGVFGLLGLLIAFTFSGAASRFEDRRHLITAEANTIGTAYLRLDLLPADAQPQLRELFRHYVSIRSTAFRSATGLDEAAANAPAWTVVQGEIWDLAGIAGRRPEAPAQATMLLLPALNEMIDITTTRDMASQNHPPPVVFLLLGGLCLISALLVGYGAAPGKDRSWFHPVIFAAILSLTVYVIVDIEYPRLGLIRVDAADQVLIDLGRQISE